MAATPKGSSKEKKGETDNKAKMEFQEYKKRMERAPTAEPKGPQFGTSHPMFSHMPMGGPFSPLTGSMPQFAHPPVPNPALGHAVTDTSGIMAHRIGETLKLGVDLLNSGLGVGLRFLQGLAGPGYHHEAGGWGHAHGAPYHAHGCGYHPHGWGCPPPGGCDCADCCQLLGCESSCCCSPSVGSCC